MSSRSNQSGKPQDMSGPIVIPLLVLAFAGLIWFIKRDSLSYLTAKFTYFMLAPLSWLNGVQSYRLGIARDVMEGPDLLRTIGWGYAGWLMPAMLVSGGCVYLALKSFRHPTRMMRGALSTDALMRYQAMVHDAIAPIVPIAREMHKNLDERWHEMYHPHEVVQKFKLTDKDNNLDREKAEDYFLKQLGTRIYRPGIDPESTIFADRLNPYEKTIFALLAPMAIKIKEGLPEYYALRRALNYSAVNETQTPDLTLAQDSYLKYREHPLLNNLFLRHHFSTTYLFALYLLAKRAGGFSTADWVGWLRPNANGLYVTLNCAGRNTPFTEAGGPFCHWKVEVACNKEKRLPIMPFVVKAVDDLQEQWDFWCKADAGVTEETMWGAMRNDPSGLAMEQDRALFRQYVSDMVRVPLPPEAAGDDSLFDEEQTSERHRIEEVAMAKIMSGVKDAFPEPPNEAAAG